MERFMDREEEKDDWEHVEVTEELEDGHMCLRCES